jgi:hypothetical protein
MATAADVRRIALALEGTTSAPHFDRTAFKVDRIYATLAPDKKTANFKFTPDEQELKCVVAPDAFQVIPNAWGRQGWTTGTLKALSVAELKAALEMAWRHAVKKPKTNKRT